MALVAAFALSASFGGAFSADYRAPGSDSSAAHELLKQHFPGSASVAATFVVQASETVDTPAVRNRIASLRARIGGVPHVSHVDDPYAGARSPDGTAVLFEAVLDVDKSAQMPIEDAQALVDTARAATDRGSPSLSAATSSRRPSPQRSGPRASGLPPPRSSCC